MLRHAFLLLAAAPLWSADTGRLEGRIIHSINRAGIAGVTVELRASGSDEPAYSAVTDPAGEFQLSGIKPGEYTASFEKNGFFRPKSDGPEDQPVRIAAGPEPVRLRVELCPYTRVSGRVLDSEGNPKPRIVVELLSAAARRRMRSFTTGDDGAFAFDELEPGAYVLRADPSRTGQARHANPEQPIQDPRQLWAPAYFPNTTDYQQAGVILARGGDLVGYDIRLPQADLFRVRGTVLDEAGRPAAGVQVGLKSADGEEIIQGAPPSMRMQTNSNGAFEFGGVGRGLWHAVAGLAFQAGSPRGFASVSILDREPREIAIRLAAPFRLRVVEEGLDARAPLGPVQGRIRLVPVEGGIEQYAISGREKDGAVSINGVYPGRYWIRIGRPPAGMHLAGLMLDERDALDQPVDLGPKSPPIRVIYRAGGGFLRGSVENGARVTVALLPRGPGSERGVYIETQCDSSGRFEFDALRPGDYYAVAFREVNGNPLEDPVFLADIGAHAAAVPVQAGTVASLELRIARWPD